MILGDNPKRCVIYFIYDKDGIIDDYVIDQLKDLRNNAQHIHCVINGKLSHDGKLALEQVADDIYVRENKGVDVGAYKAAIEYLTWDFIRTFDELVVMNNTCFGPVYPFKECFDWAKGQDVDLWGLTKGLKSDWLGTKNYLHYNKSNYHIQSYFLVFRSSLISNDVFKNFWDEIPYNCNYVQSGSFFEYAMPGYFEGFGFKSSVYCNINDDYNYPLLHNPIRLLKDYRMPLIKKRSFFHHYTDVLSNTCGEATSDIMEFIAKYTNYDMSFVWKSILRTSSLSDVVRCAQLRRILPKDYAYNSNVKLKVGIVFHFYYPELFDENLCYIKMFPKGCGVLITVSSGEKKKFLQEKLRELQLEAEVTLIENRGRDVSSLLIGAKDFIKNYDLICFTHDKKSLQNKPESVGRSWAYKLNENLYGSKEFILNTINMFEKEPFLGMAFPGYPNHSGYLKHDATGWTGNFENTEKLFKDFGVDVKINPHTLCVAPLGTCFWFRPKTLEKLMKGLDGNGWKYTDFPAEPTGKDDGLILHAIERSYAYFAQDAGFYPVFLYNDKYAAIDLTNLEFMTYYGEAMRSWCDAFALDSVGYRKFEDVYGRPWTEISDDEIIRDYSNNPIIRKFANAPRCSNKIESPLGIKESVKLLANAMRRRFPIFWKLLWPAKKTGRLMWKIYKRIK
jgi:rhamnosyltransferase